MVKKLAPELLFWVQVILASIFGGGQIIHMLTVSTVGITFVFFGAWAVFTLFNLHLALAAHKAQPSRVTIQTAFIYGLWAVITIANLGILLALAGFNWTTVDSVTVTLIGVGISILLYFREFNDPITRGWFAAIMKGSTHLVLGVGILIYGVDGVSATMIVVGHVTITIRLGQVWYSIKEAGWDRNRKGSFLSEVISEATWVATTAIWAGALLL